MPTILSINLFKSTPLTMGATLDHTSSNMSHKHDISSDISSNSNQLYMDYYEICNDSTAATNNAPSYSDMNISSDIQYSSNNNNNYYNINNSNSNNCSKLYNYNPSYYNNGDIVEIFVITFYKYYVPILVCTGSIGNILSIIVFFKTKLRKLSSSYYLAALAISDTCFLLVLFINWLSLYGALNAYSQDICCKLYTFLQFLTCFCSDWFVVAFTVERFIAVLYPLRRQDMCTVGRAKIVLSGLTIVGCIHCAPFWIVSESMFVKEKYYCDINPKYKDIMHILNYWDSFIVLAVPFILIAILNTWTACTVWKFATVRRSLTMQKRKDTLTKSSITSNSNNFTSSTYRNPKRQNSSCPHPSGQSYVSQHHHGCVLRKQSAKRKPSNATQSKVTKMLMVVSTVFVCLNLPSCVMRIKAYLESNESTNSRTTVVLQHIFELLFITNFGINFVLYCVSGQNFRKEVLSMFRRRSLTQREGTTQVTVSEYYPGRRQPPPCWNELREIQTKK